MPGFITTVAVALLVGWIGNILVKENMPAGFWGASLAALVGSWIGAYFPYFNAMWLRMFDIAIIPALIGAACGTFILGLSKTVYQKAS